MAVARWRVIAVRGVVRPTATDRDRVVSGECSARPACRVDSRSCADAPSRRPSAVARVSPVLRWRGLAGAGCSRSGRAGRPGTRRAGRAPLPLGPRRRVCSRRSSTRGLRVPAASPRDVARSAPLQPTIYTAINFTRLSVTAVGVVLRVK